MSTPKHDRCLRCGERFDGLHLVLGHLYRLQGNKRMFRFTMPPAKHDYLCLTAEEMEALGWRKWYGVWRESLSGSTAD